MWPCISHSLMLGWVAGLIKEELKPTERDGLDTAADPNPSRWGPDLCPGCQIDE